MEEAAFNPTLVLFWHFAVAAPPAGTEVFQSYFSLILTMPFCVQFKVRIVFQSYFSLILTENTVFT